MQPIHGKDCLLSVKIDSTWFPVLCAVDMTLSVTRDVVQATSAVTGLWRVHKLRGLNDWGITLSGLTKVDNTDGQISWFFMMQSGDAPMIIQVIFEDPAGEAYVLEGKVIIPSQSINANVNSFASGEISFQGTEEPLLENIIPVPTDPICEVMETLIAVLPEGEDSVFVGGINLSGSDVLWVTREGTGYTETNSTPGNLQFRVDYGAARIYFSPSNPGNAIGESVLVGWQRTY